MNDSIAQLQQILSSQDEQQIYQNGNQQVPRCSIQKTTYLKQYMFNLKYNLMHSNFVYIPYFHRPKILLQANSEPACLLGTVYEYPNSLKFIEHFRSTVWMSYRSSSHNGKGDAGWGCMIRVVQMAFAEVIKRHNPNISIDLIIGLFKQGKNHLFSLQNICTQGRIKQRWTGCNQIILAITSILNQNKMVKGVQKSSNPIISKTNKNLIDLNFNIEIYFQHLTIHDFEKFKNQQQFPKIIFISSKVSEQGNNYFPSIYADHAKSLMKMPYFCGMIGGVSNQALYIVGYQDNMAIILDPHYVQQQNQTQKVRYFKKNPRGIPFSELCQTSSFCFYLKNLQQYKNWSADLCYSFKIYKPYLIFGLQVGSPQDMIQKYRKRSQDFQLL